MNRVTLNRLPEKFVSNAIGLCGEPGKQWLDDLPQIVTAIEKAWSIRVGEAFPNLSYNYVAPCINADGTAAVLKIALPLNTTEIFNEADYLHHLAGNGTVRLLQIDAQWHAILIEHAMPGLNLKQCFADDPKHAVEIGIRVLKKIRQTPMPRNNFKLLEDWYAGLKTAGATEFPSEYAEKALNYFTQLSAIGAESLIHGDLHHENILTSRRDDFLVIDPKGIIGHTGYDVAVFLNNHHWWLAHRSDLNHVLNDSIAQFAKAFDLDPRDIRKWAFCQMVLSAWWTYEENAEAWRGELALADIWDV